MPYESRCRPTSPPTTAAPQFSVPVDVASHTGAMQAQEHRIQRWAVATRTRNPSQEAFMSCFSQRITRIRRISLFTLLPLPLLFAENPTRSAKGGCYAARLRAELAPKVKRMNDLLQGVKDSYASHKLIIKNKYPQERWADYGLPDKR